MGSWNTTPFGNDTAMDWLHAMTSHANARDLLAEAFARIESSEYPDAPEAEEALAAASIVAAAATDPIGAIVPDARRWISTTGFVPDPSLLDRALRAISSIARKSELRDLYEEAQALDGWLKQVDKSAQRLQQGRDFGVPARSPKAAAAPRRLDKMIELYAALPDPKLRERIRAKVAALKDPDGRTSDTDFIPPLTLMARYGMLEEARLLIARGADPTLESSRAFTQACASGHLAVAELLREAGANVFHEHRFSPEAGIRVQVAVKSPDEPVQGHRYCMALFGVALAGSPLAANYLRELGASFDQTNLNGETLLHSAGAYGHVPMLRFFLGEGLDPNRVMGKSGESPLHYAARAGKVESVRALLEGGANPNIIDRFEGEKYQWSQTPLDVAESREVSDLLIAHGARSGGSRAAVERE